MKFIATKNITLFIDIEWSQPTNVFEIEKSQILQIAGIGIKQNGTEYKRFARSVRPTNPEEVSELSLELIGAQLESLTRATQKEVAVRNFFTTFYDIKNFVVWNKNAYDLLMYDAEKLGLKFKKHNVIVVQDLIRTISKVRCITFEETLDMLGVEHNKSLLHHAKYDVDYLLKAAHSLVDVFAQAKATAEVTYYRTQNTGLIHGAYCGYLSNSKYIEELPGDKVLFGGRLCSCCVNRGKFRIVKLKKPKKESIQQGKTQNKQSKQSKQSKQNKQSKQPHFPDRSHEYTEENINRLMDKYDMNIRFGAGDMLYVDSGKTKWRIYYDNTGVERVYHENYKNLRYTRQDMNNTKYKKINSGFHIQDVKTKSLEGVLKYIKKHDENFVIKFKKEQIGLFT